MNELATNIKNKNIRDLYRGIKGTHSSIVVKALCYKPEGSRVQYPMK
jgi:hypothetical protein